MHGCFNGIGVWFIEGVAGIRVHASENPPLTIRAGVDAGDIVWAKGRRAALHGTAESSWAIEDHGFTHNVTIPLNAVAKVMIPAERVSDVSESGKALSVAAGVTAKGVEVVNHISYVVLTVESGEYRFGSGWKRGVAMQQASA